MLAANMPGTILIRDKTLLPAGLMFETEVFLPGWRAAKNLDGYDLGRKIEQATWNFFYLAGEVRVTVLGSASWKTLRRAVRRVLARYVEQRFNSLEICKVVSKRFLGIPFMSVTVHSRHIQQDICLAPANDAVSSLSAPFDPKIIPDIAGKRQHAEGITREYTALISSS
jgi:hypothetical protein